jgi:hypothetical protein
VGGYPYWKAAREKTTAYITDLRFAQTPFVGLEEAASNVIILLILERGMTLRKVLEGLMYLASLLLRFPHFHAFPLKNPFPRNPEISTINACRIARSPFAEY